MSVLTYNGITLSLVHTHSIQFTPQWSDDEMDYLYTEILINISAVFNKNISPATPLGNESPTNTMARVRHALLTPRGALTFTVANDTLFSLPLPNASTDLIGGPIPESCTISQVGGTETFLIDYSIRTAVIECIGSSPNYLSNRWTESVEIDEEGFSTYVRTGKIVCRLDLNINPDTLRGVFSPGIQPGFKRLSSSYVLASDGKSMQYTFRDREQYLQPPAPAVKADGTYAETTANGAIRYADCRVHLRGSAGTDKAALLATAVLICISKLKAAGVEGSTAGRYLAIGGIREKMWENDVEVQFKAIIRPGQGRLTTVPFDPSRFVIPPVGSEPGTPAPDPGTRGTAGLTLAAQLLKDPCLQQSTLVAGGVGFPGGSVLKTGGGGGGGGPGGQGATVSVVPILPNDQGATRYAANLTAGLVIQYQVHKRYENNLHRYMLPVAAATPSPPVAFCQVANPTLQLVIEWSAESLETPPPVLPDLAQSDPNAVLLWQEISPSHIEPAGDGSFLRFRVSGKYIYGFQNPSKATVSAAIPPFVDSSVETLVKLTFGLLGGN